MNEIINGLRDEISQLKSERNELAATVEALRDAYSELSQNGGTVERLRIAAVTLMWSAVFAWCLYAVAWVWL